MILQMLTPYDIKLVLCRKLHLFVGISTKTAATGAALLDSNMHQIVCRLALRSRPHWGSLQRSPDPLAVFRGLRLNGGEMRGGRGEGRGGSSSFAVGRKKRKVGAYVVTDNASCSWVNLLQVSLVQVSTSAVNPPLTMLTLSSSTRGASH